MGSDFKRSSDCSVMLFSLQSVQNFINQTWLERYDSQISEQALTLLWSTIVSIFTIGGFVGASIGGTLAIRFGRYVLSFLVIGIQAVLISLSACIDDLCSFPLRKGTLLFNNLFALLAALFMGLSFPTGAFELLIVGRFFTGLNAGKHPNGGNYFINVTYKFLGIDMPLMPSCLLIGRYWHLYSASLPGGNSP